MSEPPDPRYPKLKADLPAHLLAKLQATATVLRRPARDIVERAIEERLNDLRPDQRELVDRIATALLHSHELDDD